MPSIGMNLGGLVARRARCFSSAAAVRTLTPPLVDVRSFHEIEYDSHREEARVEAANAASRA